MCKSSTFNLVEIQIAENWCYCSIGSSKSVRYVENIQKVDWDVNMHAAGMRELTFVLEPVLFPSCRSFLRAGGVLSSSLPLDTMYSCVRGRGQTINAYHINNIHNLYNWSFVLNNNEQYWNTYTSGVRTRSNHKGYHVIIIWLSLRVFIARSIILASHSPMTDCVWEWVE